MSTPATSLPPSSATLTVNLVQAGQAAAVVLGALYTLTDDTSEERAQKWSVAAWTTLLQPICSGDVTATTAVMRDFQGLVIETPVVGGGSGGNAGAGGLVAAASALIKWSTATGGRSGKGRTFVPGLPATAVVSGRSYATGYRTSVQTAVNAYLASAGLVDAGLDPAVLSRTKNAGYPIIAGSLSTVVGIQRRRMR